MATKKTRPTWTEKSKRPEHVPAAACCFAASEVEVTPNGEDADTAKFRMVARSGDPIDHWYWGKIAHDLDGYRMSGNKVAIDYAHNDSEVIGFANKFEVNDEGLVASGALTPFKEDDRASEVVFKAKKGVPWEASINFSGGPLTLETVAEDKTAQVNGYTFSGPGVIVREWPLRGIAVCPYGADGNTSTEFSADDTVSVSYTGEETMADEKVDVLANNEAIAEAFAANGGTLTKEQPATVEGAAAPVETRAGDDNGAEAAPSELAVDAPQVPAEKYFERFGEQQGALYFAKGVSYDEALEVHLAAQQETIQELERKLSAQATAGEDEPVGESEGTPRVKTSALTLPSFMKE